MPPEGGGLSSAKRRQAARGGRPRPDAQSRTTRIALACSGRRWLCAAGGDSVFTRPRRAACRQRRQAAPGGRAPRPHGAAGRECERGDRWDSNPRPPGPQPGALPTELRPPRAGQCSTPRPTPGAKAGFSATYPTSASGGRRSRPSQSSRPGFGNHRARPTSTRQKGQSRATSC